MTTSTVPVPDDPRERAGQRLTMDYPVELLERPKAGRTVRAPRARTPSNRLSTIVARTRLLNHPGHSSQKSHGRKGQGYAAGQGRLGPKASKLPKVDNPDDIRAQAMGANPNYLGPYRGPGAGGTYAHNCSRVAIAYELRRRGIDVTAGAGTSLGETTDAYVQTFRDGGKYATRVQEDLGRRMTSREVAAEVESWPMGARGIVTISGHTLNVERDAKTGKAVFVDAQAASRRVPVMDRAGFVRRTKSRGAPDDHMAVARVDDLDVSDYGLRFVEGKGLDLADGQVGGSELPGVQTPQGLRRATTAEIDAMTPDDSYP